MEPTLTLTAVARDAVRAAFETEGLNPDTAHLRVAVMPGGCSGFRYSLSLEEAAVETDRVAEADGVRLLIDPFSAQYLNGVTIDFKSTLQGNGFEFKNPTATGQCGCGSSFGA